MKKVQCFQAIGFKYQLAPPYTTAATGAAALSVAAGAAVLPVALAVYAASKLMSIDYNSPSEMAALRIKFVANPESVFPWHKPYDMFKTAEECVRALRDAAGANGSIPLAAACRKAKGGGLPAVLKRSPGKAVQVDIRFTLG